MFRRASRRGSACYRADFDRTYAWSIQVPWATRLYALRIRTASRPTLPAEVRLNPMMRGAEHRRCPSPISEATEGIQPIELRAQYGVCQSPQFRAGVSENITAATRQTITQIARSPSDASRTPATGGDCQPSIDLGTSNIARHAVSTLRPAAFELCGRRGVASHCTIDEMNMIGSHERWHEAGQVSRCLPVSAESADLSPLSHG